MASSLGSGKMITDGLVLHLDAANTKSYPGSGTVWTDLSQTATTGSLTNGPTFSSVNNGGILFDGTNDYVELGNTLNSYVNVSKSLSIEAVVTIVSSSNNNTISANGWDTGGFNFRKLTTNGIRFIYLQDGNKYCGFDSSVLSNGIYHLVATYNGLNVNNTGSYNLYVNGVVNNSSSINSGTITSVEPSRSFSVGSVLDSLNGRQGYYSGSIHIVKLYNRALSATEVFQNYESTRERFNRPTTITDFDALNFVNVANISSDTQQIAVNTLVTDLKGTGLWGKMKAIYPMVGGTATSHKWNLKDPRDLDAAFRLTFSGGLTHSSAGVLPNGTTGYMNTNLVINANLASDSAHCSLYFPDDNAATTNIDFGVAKDATSLWQCQPKYNLSGTSTLLFDMWNATTNRIESLNSNAQGFYVDTRTSNTSHKAFRNNIQVGSTNTSTASGFTGLNLAIYIGVRNTNNTPTNYASNRISFATIGDGLTDTDASNLYTIVQKYQTTLGRQV